MATPEQNAADAYRRALLFARDRSYQLNRSGVDRLYRAFAEVLNRLAAEEGSEILTSARAERLRQEIDAMLRVLNRQMRGITEDAVGGTIIDLVEIHRQATNEVFRQFGRTAVLSQAFDAVPARALAAMFGRPGAISFQTLYNRRIGSLAAEIDTFLDAAVTRGVSAGRGAKDLARLMARDDPRLLRLLDRADVLTGDLHRGAGAIDYAAYGLSEDDTKALRGILYDARRIQVSETNNALRAANDMAAAESPVVEATKWQRSGRHSVPDVCDMLAESDTYGYGPGWYPAGKFPVAPHAHCGCYPGAVKFRRPSEWSQPKTVRILRIDPNETRYTERWAESWTENERERYQREFAAILRTNDGIRRAA